MIYGKNNVTLNNNINPTNFDNFTLCKHPIISLLRLIEQELICSN